MISSRGAAHSRSALHLMVLILAASFSASGCSDGSWLGMEQGATEQSASISGTWRVFTIASLVVGGLVLSLILYAAVRFRRRNDVIADPAHDEGAHILADEAWDVLGPQGFTRDDVIEWAETYLMAEHSGDVASFVAWIADHEHKRTQG